jgi:hypothetical protein
MSHRITFTIAGLLFLLVAGTQTALAYAGVPSGSYDRDSDVLASGETLEDPRVARFFVHHDHYWNVVALTKYRSAGGAGNGNILERLFAQHRLPFDAEKRSYQNHHRERLSVLYRFSQRDPLGTFDYPNAYIDYNATRSARLDVNLVYGIEAALRFGVGILTELPGRNKNLHINHAAPGFNPIPWWLLGPWPTYITCRSGQWPNPVVSEAGCEFMMCEAYCLIGWSDNSQTLFYYTYPCPGTCGGGCDPAATGVVGCVSAACVEGQAFFNGVAWGNDGGGTYFIKTDCECKCDGVLA